MAINENDVLAVQTELAQRVAKLSVQAGGVRTAPAAVATLAREIDDIRRIALHHGMLPVASIAQALESALGRGDTGPLVTGWIAILRESIDSDRQDAVASASWAGLCSVRLAG